MTGAILIWRGLDFLGQVLVGSGVLNKLLQRIEIQASRVKCALEPRRVQRNKSSGALVTCQATSTFHRQPIPK